MSLGVCHVVVHSGKELLLVRYLKVVLAGLRQSISVGLDGVNSVVLQRLKDAPGKYFLTLLDRLDLGEIVCLELAELEKLREIFLNCTHI